jgi:hypothetical protein
MMTDHTPAPARNDDELTFDEAQGLAVEQLRAERAGKIRELRRQLDVSKERTRRAQARFDRAVVLTASTRPDREDWYEHPGELPRKTLLAAAELNTMGLHRIMERYRKTASKAGRRSKR